MKEAIDLKGKKVMVPITTPTKNIDGVRYLLSPQELADLKAQEDEYNSEQKQIERDNADAWAKRRAEYGSAEQQLEYAVEFGWDALVTKNRAINQKYPLK